MKRLYWLRENCGAIIVATVSPITIIVLVAAIVGSLLSLSEDVEADTLSPRPGGSVGRNTMKVIREYDDGIDNQLNFAGANSDWITTSRSTAIFNATGGTLSFTLEAEGPDGLAYAIEDFNSDAAISVSDDHCKNLTSAIFPYNRIRLVITAGTGDAGDGVLVEGAD